MDFLLDINASGAVARWLIDQGHDVNDALNSHVKDLEAGAIVIALSTKFRIRKRG